MIRYAFMKLGIIFGTCLFLVSNSAIAQNAAPPTKTDVSPLTVNTVDVTRSPDPMNIDASAQGRVERPFKKKILVTAFAVNKLAQVADIDNIEQGFPRELLRKLDQSNKFLIRRSTNLLSLSNQMEAASPKLVRQVAVESDSQFVISGEIRNAGIRIENKFWGLWKTNKRHIEIEFSVFDGMSGVLLAKHTVVKQAQDRATVGLDKPFGSAVFYATTYGKVVNEILDESIKLIAKDLDSYGVLAKILKIENGQIFIDAGKTSQILAGDLATVEAVSNELPTMSLNSSPSPLFVYGLPRNSIGKIAIIQSQQSFSIGELSADVKLDAVKVGDLVRFDNLPAY